MKDYRLKDTWLTRSAVSANSRPSAPSPPRGRKRQHNPLIPAHVDQAKLPTNVYFDHRWGTGTWYVLSFVDGNRKRKNIANAKATLVTLYNLVEALSQEDNRGTLDWLCQLFSESDKFTQLAKGTREDYDYCRSILQKRKNASGALLAKLPLSSFSPPIIQKLVDSIGKTHPSKANHLLRYLRRLFRWGGNRGYCNKVNPADKIEPATERRNRAVPDLPVMECVLDYARHAGTLKTRTKGSHPPYLLAVAEIAYRCRLRGIEVVTLSDANSTALGILTNRRKGSRDNITRWSPTLRMAWDALIANRTAIWKRKRLATPLNASNRPLVVAEDGRPLARAVLTNAWKRLMLSAISSGVIQTDQRFGIHAFKRRGITDTPGTIADKQLASGHKTQSMVHTYDFSLPLVSPAGS